MASRGRHSRRDPDGPTPAALLRPARRHPHGLVESGDRNDEGDQSGILTRIGDRGTKERRGNRQRYTYGISRLTGTKGHTVAFKRTQPLQREQYDDPVDLYLRLSERGGPGPIWDHQAQVLRSWHSAEFRNASDVALELPTGAGKTLVAGLIGDFQRRTSGDRVAYLCLTKQLAAQTAQRLSDYGIPNVLLTGRVRTWDRAARGRYQSSDAVAVSTYSHVFNSNPALDDVTTLLLDDAHGAADFVAHPWSLVVDRGPIYSEVLSVLTSSLDPLVLQALRREGADSEYRTGVYLASPVGVSAVAGELESVLYQAAMSSALNGDAAYARQFLEGRIDRCLVYVAHRGLLIRPLTPPTVNHPAFDDPARRVYLSATLGHGGELERSFGRRRIRRIPVPKGWDKRGTGRRLFCFPELTADLSREPDLVSGWVESTIADAGRAVALAPDFRTTDAFVDQCVPNGFDVFDGESVEETLNPFTDTDTGVLALSNRYDGIDLPDEDCRLVVLDGLPAKGDLQERFLYSALGAQNVLQERIRARIAQGAGRATRNARDYATVVVLGDDLISYLGRHDVQSAFHPDLHAEIEFGWRNSLGVESSEVTANIGIFDEHSSEWAEVEQDLLAQRDEYTRVDPSGASNLNDAVAAEVDACNAIWSGEWTAALDACRRVVDALSGSRTSRRYAALWNYIAMFVARRLYDATSDQQYSRAATAYLHEARMAARGTSWLGHLAASSDATVAADTDQATDPLDELAIRNVLDRVPTLGKSSKFEPAVAAMSAALANTPHSAYEQGIVDLGLFAGASESLPRSKVDAAPDGAWLFGDITWVTWEAKSEAKPTGELGADDTREAGGHLRHVANSRSEDAPEDSFGFIIAPQERIHPASIAVAEEHLWLLRPTDLVDLSNRLVRAWRRIRSTNADTETVVGEILSDEGVLPTQWCARLRHQRVKDEAQRSADGAG